MGQGPVGLKRLYRHLGPLVRMLKGEKVLLNVRGHCPTCRKDVRFVATNPWFRDHLLCPNCGSKPRERALMRTLEMFFPDWPERVIHESSPIKRGASIRLAKECRHYIPSQLFGDTPLGAVRNGVRCEDLGHLTFADESIDLHVTQDVLEHVLHPEEVFREIARTLRPGGAHVFTVPIVNKHKSSQARALLDDGGQVVHLLPPVYHGNPVSADGALVTVDWGFDICQRIFDASGLFTHIVHLDDPSHGIRAEYIEVLVSVKPVPGELDAQHRAAAQDQK